MTDRRQIGTTVPSGTASSATTDRATAATARPVHERIILSASDQVTCPKCEKGFRLEEGLARTTIEQYEAEFELELRRRADEQRERIAKDERARLEAEMNESISALKRSLAKTAQQAEEKQRQIEAESQARINSLEQLLAKRDIDLKAFEAEIESVRVQARARAEKQFAEERLALERELEDCTAKIAAFNAGA